MPKTQSLNYKINLSIIITFMGIAALFSGVLSFVEIERRDNAVAKIEESLNDTFAQYRERLANEMFAEQERAIRVTFQEMMSRQGIVAATVYDYEGQVIASTQDPQPPALDIPEDMLEKYALEPLMKKGELNGEDVLSYMANVHAFGEFVGFFNVKYSLAALNRETMHTVLAFIGFLLTTLLLMAVILNRLLLKLVLRPVYKLGSVMDRVKDGASCDGSEGDDARDMRAVGDTLARMSTDLGALKLARDEIGSLARSFDTMLGELESAYTDLTAAENKFRDIFENAVEGIFQLSTDKELINANKAMARLFGWDSPASFISKAVGMEVDRLADPKELDRFLADVEAKGSVAGVEMAFARKNGETFWGAISARAVRGAGGETLYFEGTLVDSTERLEKERAQAEREAARAAAKARSVFLDNSGQGFLSFGPDLLVDSEYSRECEQIFGRDPSGVSIMELLFPGDRAGGEEFAKKILRTMDQEDEFRRDLFLSLQQNEFQLGDIWLEAEYKIVEQGHMMLILTDITERRELEHEVRVERQRLKFVVSTVRESHDFFEILDDFETFRRGLELGLVSSLDNSGPDTALNEMYRAVHTFKGLFSQQDFIHLPPMLHNLEDHLSRLKKDDSPAMEKLKTFVEDCPFEETLHKDLAVVEQMLGSDFMRRRGEINITEDQAKNLAEMAERILGASLGDLDEDMLFLLREVARLSRVNFRSLLAAYPRGTFNMALRFEKKIHPFSIEGDDIMVHPDIYAHFTKTLVHVFRNAVAHGIEDPEEREDAGKDEAGTITCTVAGGENSISIEIADDGRGLDVEGLKAGAAEKGLYTMEELEGFSMAEIYNLVFLDGISTSGEITDLSGRGVGMSTVKAELDKIGGKVDIHSTPGQGTVFVFNLPGFSFLKKVNKGDPQ